MGGSRQQPVVGDSLLLIISESDIIFFHGILIFDSGCRMLPANEQCWTSSALITVYWTERWLKEVKQLQLSAMDGVVNGCCVGSLLMFVFLVSIIVTDFAYSVTVRRRGRKEIVASVVYIVVCIDRFGY